VLNSIKSPSERFAIEPGPEIIQTVFVNAISDIVLQSTTLTANTPRVSGVSCLLSMKVGVSIVAIKPPVETILCQSLGVAVMPLTILLQPVALAIQARMQNSLRSGRALPTSGSRRTPHLHGLERQRANGRLRTVEYSQRKEKA